MTRAPTVDVLREMIFTNNKVPPTKAQMDYIKDIVRSLGLKTPTIKTRRGASRFITKHSEAYYAWCQEMSTLYSGWWEHEDAGDRI